MEKYPDHCCPYPFTQATTTPTGLWKLCCSASEAHGSVSDFPGEIKNSISQTSMTDYWSGAYLNWVRDQHSQNIPIKECEACFKYEQNGNESYRQRAIKELGPIKDMSKTPISLDLKLGNLCNAACLFCDPSSSSKIQKEWTDIGWNKNTPFKAGLTGWIDESLFEVNYNWANNPEFWKSLLDVSGNLRNLKFTGGEPLINKFMIEYLKFLTDEGLAQNIRLQTTTNGIVVPDKFLNILGEFKEVQLNFSVDGVGKQNEYIRYPTKWSSWLKNIDRVLATVGSNTELYFQHSISAYSVFGLKEYFRWMWPYKKFNFHLFKVFQPDFQRPEVLHHNDRNRVIQDLEFLIEELEPTVSCARDENLLKEIRGIQNFLAEKESLVHLQDQLRDYIYTLDRHRGTCVADFMPEAARVLFS